LFSVAALLAPAIKYSSLKIWTPGGGCCARRHLAAILSDQG